MSGYGSRARARIHTPRSVDNRPRSVHNLGTLGITRGVSSPDARGGLTRYVNLNVMRTAEPDDPAELLSAGEVCRLLHIARSTLPLWRARGDLRGYKLRNGHWRYPSNQPALTEARAALRPAQ